MDVKHTSIYTVLPSLELERRRDGVLLTVKHSIFSGLEGSTVPEAGAPWLDKAASET